MATAGLQTQGSAEPWARPAPYRTPGRRFAVAIVMLGVVAVALFAGTFGWTAWRDRTPHPRRATIGYQQFLTLVGADQVQSIYYDNSTGVVTGALVRGHTQRGMSHFEAQGPSQSLPPTDVISLVRHHVVIGSELGGPQATSRGRMPLWVDAFEWGTMVQGALTLLAMVGVAGLIWMRQRAAAKVPAGP
jgi:hypothetical protein